MRAIVPEASDMHATPSMSRRGHIDRTKHEVDVTERVLNGGVAGPIQLDHGQVVDLEVGIRAWPLVTAVSAVQVSTPDPERDDR
jgi:hypothetical protein